MVERLMPFLDAQSTLALVKALPLALEVIQRKFMWIKLVRRVCPFDTDDGVAEFEETLADDRRKVMPLVEILKMIEDPNLRLLDLLHIICERFPSVDRDDVPVMAPSLPGIIRVSCSCEQTSHSVSPFGFLLLEAVEGVMETTEQKVEEVVVRVLDEFLMSALESRLFRQQDLADPWGTPVGLETKVDASRLDCNNSRESAEVISTLMQYCQSIEVHGQLFIWADIGIEGWAALGSALSENFVNLIVSYKKSTASARRDDLRALWECATHGWGVLLGENRLHLQLFEEWDLFERFLDGEEDVDENEDEEGDEDNDV